MRVHAAKEKNCKIKLIAWADNGGDALRAFVGPCLLPHAHGCALVEGPVNTVRLNSRYLGESSYTGAGAGRYPTATSVCADIREAAIAETAPRQSFPPLVREVLHAVPCSPSKARHLVRIAFSFDCLEGRTKAMEAVRATAPPGSDVREVEVSPEQSYAVFETCETPYREVEQNAEEIGKQLCDPKVLVMRILEA
eukprot:GHVU01122436.1.p1 GENE.GHVU01122436.1~~GHVU01122436.1.p1  ORF type:complete len:195 (-),score=26.90 GHVU01122436.1:392-976(-)